MCTGKVYFDMVSQKRRPGGRRRVGRVSYYSRGNGWHLYYRDGLQQIRRRVADDEKTAATIAAQVNAQLATQAPTAFSFTPVSITKLRADFLAHHDEVLRSSLATVSRYRSATAYLEEFAVKGGGRIPAHEIDVTSFVAHLRRLRVAPNGHRNAKRRPLRDKGVRFILETCRSLYSFAAKRRHLPPYAENPFAGLGGKRTCIEDAKPIFVFDEESEAAFFRSVDAWSLPLHVVLAKTGLRVGEALHLYIADVDFAGGWIHVGNKPGIHWRVKTRRERDVPMHPIVAAAMKYAIGLRSSGLVFQRSKYAPRGRDESEQKHARRIEDRVGRCDSASEVALSRRERTRIAKAVLQEAGLVRADQVRLTFMRTTSSVELQGASCPKSWRHTFATLLQEANVDPLIRQLVLGHAPTMGFGAPLGMTTVYTHSRPGTIQSEICRAIDMWATSLNVISQRLSGEGKSC